MAGRRVALTLRRTRAERVAIGVEMERDAVRGARIDLEGVAVAVVVDGCVGAQFGRTGMDGRRRVIAIERVRDESPERAVRRRLRRITVAVAVQVAPVAGRTRLGQAAAARSRGGLERIVRTPVGAVGRPVAVRIGPGRVASAGPRRHLGRVVRAIVGRVVNPVAVAVEVVAVRDAVTVEVGHGARVGHSVLIAVEVLDSRRVCGSGGDG
jgi:hypothetical protein